MVKVKGGDDVWLAGEMSSLAVKEMDDELFVGGEEPETGW